MHHSAISKEVRAWVEEALYDGRLAVVCTSSLDLGVDFRPVDCVVQIGSPKGVSRFVQRAGRSGQAGGNLEDSLCAHAQFGAVGMCSTEEGGR